MLLLDEPLSALDAQVRVHLRSEIRELQQRLGITTIMVTHDQEEGLTMADRIILMNHGRLIQCDSPQGIYQKPKTAFAAGFIGAMNFFEGWEVVDAETLRLANYTLKTPDGQLANMVGRQVSVAIRPEDIRVLDTEGAETNVVQATIRNIEFRGSSYRLRLRLTLDETLTEASPIFEADMPAIRLERLDIHKNDSIAVYLPPNRLLWFISET